MSGLKASIVNTSTAGRLILGLFLFALCGGAAYLIVLKPQQTVIKTGTQNTAQLMSSIKTSNEQFKSLSSMRDSLTAAGPQQREKLKSMGVELFTEESLTEFFAGMKDIAAQAGIAEFTPSEQKEISTPSIIKLANASGGEDLVEINRLAVKIEFRSNFAGLSKFMQSLRQSRRYITLSDLSVRSADYSGRLQVSMVLYLYHIGGS